MKYFNRKNLTIFAGSLFVNLAAMIAFADDHPTLEQSIKSLEERQDEIFQQLSSDRRQVSTFFNDRISFGGFFDSAAASGIWGPSTPAQFTTSTTNLALDLDAEIVDRLRFNAQTLFTAQDPLENQNNNPNGAKAGFPTTRQFGSFALSTSLSQAYLEYASNSEFSIQVGKGYVPFGISFSQRDLVLFIRRGGPQMLATNSVNSVSLVSPTWSGAHLTGSLTDQPIPWGYDAYTLTPDSNTNSIGGGARLWANALPRVTFGVSSQVAKRSGYTYEALGADAKLKVDRFGSNAEYVINLSEGEGGNPSSFYVEPYYTFFSEKFLIYGAVDFINDPLGQLGDIADPYERWEFGGGVNWMPFHPTRFRLGVLYNDYVGNIQNYVSLDLSAGLEF